jgi:hypothetical protein
VRSCVWEGWDVGVSVVTKALAGACACVAVVTQHAKRRRIAMCGLSGSTTFFDIIS